MSTLQQGLVRLGPVATLENLQAIPLVGERCFFPPAAMRLGPNPMVDIDHDRGREIGRILRMFEADECTHGRVGPWLFAHFEVTDAPSWLRRGTKASLTYVPLGESSIVGQACHRGLVTRFAVLTPGIAPAEPLAEVLTISDAPVAAMSRASETAHAGVVFGYGEMLAPRTAAREPQGEVFYGDGRIAYRPCQITGVR